MSLLNPKNLFNHVFELHKRDTFRILLPFMMIIGLVASIFVYINNLYNVKSLELIKISEAKVFFTVLGFALSALLVLRINTAYERWWEGRKLWGTLITTTRNFAIQINVILPQEEITIRNRLHALICNYIHVTEDHLRNKFDQNGIEECDVLTFEEIQAAEHKPNRIARQLLFEIRNLESMKMISSIDFLILNENLKSYTETTGACERIKKSPIPASYSRFFKKFLFFYIVCIMYAFSSYYGYLGIIPILLVFYTFASLVLISEEIEDPFGVDAHDLPTHEFVTEIKKNLRDILSNK